MLHRLTAVMAAVADVAGILKLASMPNCTANPTAPPAGTPLLMVKLACFTCWDCQ